MNYDDYYAQQVGGALPYFAGARVQRGHRFGSLFGGILRSVAPLIKRGALLATPSPPGKRVKRAAAPQRGNRQRRPVKRAARRRLSPKQTCFPSMAFVHRHSCEGVKSELDLFAVPPTLTSIDYGGWIEHQPITSLDSGGPIEFVVPGAGYAYTDLANTYLLVRAKVVRGVGTDIADDTPVAPVNNWLHSLFSQVDVHLNDTLVTPSSNTYPFGADVETLLSYGAEAKKTQLTSQLWYKDMAGHMEATQENGGNAGLVERRRHIAGSRVVEMMGRLHVDLFMQDRFLINGVTVKIRLVRSKDAFSLMAGGANPDYKVRIVDAVLFVRKAVLSPTVAMAHIRALEKGTAKYPLRPTARYTRYRRAPGRARTRTCSSEHCRNASSCGASTTTRSTAHSGKNHFTRRTTPLTS